MKLKGLTLLYVEDEPQIQNELLSVLKLFGLDVICAKNGQEALKKFGKYKDIIKIILTDIKMPKLDGISMIKEIRKKDQDVPILVTTAYNELNLLEECINLKVSSYLLKPIDIFILKKKIITAIEPNILKEKLVEKNKKIKKEVKKNKKKHKLLLKQSRLSAMGEMIGIIAHQWRQPLSSISMAASHIKYKINSNEFKLERNQRDFLMRKLDNIEDFTDTMSCTIDDFRNFYKIDKISSFSNTKEEINIALNMLNLSFETNNIKIVKELNSKKKIEMYKNEIVHVLVSILKNSEENFLIKSIKKRVITLETKDSLSGVDIIITDTGKGIKENKLGKIFEPYYTTKEEINGTGLGLYISKMIIEKSHKGRILAKNSTTGLCFILSLRDTVHE